MRVLLDSGALLALERGDVAMWARYKRDLHTQRRLITHGGIVGQVWRGGAGRQALLARALPGVAVVALDDRLGRAAGLLLARTGTSDVADAALAALARPGDQILTSDPDDLDRLTEANGFDVEIVTV